MDGCMLEDMDGSIDGRMGRWIDGWIDRWRDGWWMDGCMHMHGWFELNLVTTRFSNHDSGLFCLDVSFVC